MDLRLSKKWVLVYAVGNFVIFGRFWTIKMFTYGMQLSAALKWYLQIWGHLKYYSIDKAHVFCHTVGTSNKRRKYIPYCFGNKQNTKNTLLSIFTEILKVNLIVYAWSSYSAKISSISYLIIWFLLFGKKFLVNVQFTILFFLSKIDEFNPQNGIQVYAGVGKL